MLDDLHHGEGESGIFHDFLFLEEFALEVEQVTGDGFGFLGMLTQFFFLDVEDACKVAQEGLAIEEPGVLADAVIEFLLGVVLVVDVAHNLLEHVLEGGDALCAAILVDDDGHVHLLLAEVLEQVVEHAGLGDEIGGTHERLPLEGIVAGADVGQEVLGIEDALDVVGRFLIDRHARITRVDDLAYHLVEVVVLVYIHHIDARAHDVAHRLVAKGQDALEQLLIIGILDLAHLEGSREVIDREFLGLCRNDLVDQTRAAHQQQGERREQLERRLEGRRGYCRKLGIEIGGVQLGNHLAKEQNQEGEDDGLYNEIQYRAIEIEHLVHRIVEHNGNHDVDQIVAHQDGSQQLLGHGQQLTHTLAAVRILDAVHILGAQREIGNLAARIKCRQEKSQNGDNDGDDAARRGQIKCHKRMAARIAEYR